MISIRKLMSQQGAEAPLLRVIQLLLQGMILHAIEGKPDDQERFRNALNSVLQAFDTESDGQEMLLHAGTAIRALQDYNQRTSEYLRAPAKELQAMVKMLTATIGTIASSGKENVRQLGEIEQQVVSATQVEDVRQIRAKLAECLDQIRQEVERQREETSRTLDRLSHQMEQTFQKTAAHAEDLDEVTKLPGRSVAEDTLAAACQAEKPAFVAVMALDRIKIYNLRFGPKVGDEVMHHFAKRIGQRLRPEDRLFKWSGPILVALLPRTTRLEIVREELERAIAAPFEYEVQTASRGVLLPVSSRWALFPMMASPRLLFQKIDSFGNIPGGSD